MKQLDKDKLIDEIVSVLQTKLQVDTKSETIQPTKTDNPTEMLTIKEAALLIDGLTEYRIRQMCITGELPHFKAGKKYLISEKALYKAIS